MHSGTTGSIARSNGSSTSLAAVSRVVGIKLDISDHTTRALKSKLGQNKLLRVHARNKKMQQQKTMLIRNFSNSEYCIQFCSPGHKYTAHLSAPR
jgi:hypothetical protein